MEKYKTLQDEDLATMDDLGCNLILYNDDYHTFDYVIKALMDICRHT
ncbi:MAG: ATP-dependent Clp protease adaptor ClpS, partial [Bacteroidales bacterium]|nr:ATP-dependent Clp protease adaptor ClpS [Bacteroidales bacterium]